MFSAKHSNCKRGCEFYKTENLPRIVGCVSNMTKVPFFCLGALKQIWFLVVGWYFVCFHVFYDFNGFVVLLLSVWCCWTCAIYPCFPIFGLVWVVLSFCLALDSLGWGGALWAPPHLTLALFLFFCCLHFLVSFYCCEAHLVGPWTFLVFLFFVLVSFAFGSTKDTMSPTILEFQGAMLGQLLSSILIVQNHSAITGASIS